jgi:hypothetical protein
MTPVVPEILADLAARLLQGRHDAEPHHVKQAVATARLIVAEAHAGEPEAPAIAAPEPQPAKAAAAPEPAPSPAESKPEPEAKADFRPEGEADKAK